MEKELIEEMRGIIHSYYPRGVPVDDPAYFDSDEARRLEAMRLRAVKNDHDWNRLLEALRAASPDCRIEDWTHLATDKDASYRCRVEMPPGESLHAVVACVSILVPFYLVYSSQVRRLQDRFAPPEVRYELTDEEAGYGQVVTSNIEAIFGYSPMPPDIGMQPVSDVAVGNVEIGKATLYDCLFTDDRW
ncbi:MAG TPA: hypothetical protein VE262_12160 [Blastocatellia bacterium]|nr:hypothetical protein [Blastocatellia bacterium]